MDGHHIVVAGGPPQGPDQSQGAQTRGGVFNLLYSSDEALHVTQVDTWQQHKLGTKEVKEAHCSAIISQWMNY